MPGRDPRKTKQAKGRKLYNKGGKAFPDMSGDGKVTKKDILIAKGVIKNGKAMSKRKSSSKKKI